MNLRSLLCVLPCLLLAACDGPTSTTDNSNLTQKPGPNDGQVGVTIIGAGSVSYDFGGVNDCSGDGATTVKCPVVLFHDGTGMMTAKPAIGWRFTGWSTTFGNGSPSAITDGSKPTQSVLPGSNAALTATFVPNVHPLKATFIPSAFSTTYVLDVDNADLDIIKVEWSGPNCGDFDPKEGLGAEPTTSFAMTWRHPHDPQNPNSCGATTDHKEVTVRATVTIKDKTFVCEYQGADSGVGTPCR